jgi:hypothetical protein
MEDNAVRVFGYCAHCGEPVTDEGEDYFVNEDGEVFCCIECVCEHCRVVKIEL